MPIFLERVPLLVIHFLSVASGPSLSVLLKLRVWNSRFERAFLLLFFFFSRSADVLLGSVCVSSFSPSFFLVYTVNGVASAVYF